MTPIEYVSIALDLLLCAAAVIAYLNRPRVGGQLAKGMRTLLMGLVLLGTAHFIETILFSWFFVDRGINEVLHRLLVAIGFVFVIWGFATMRKAFEK